MGMGSKSPPGLSALIERLRHSSAPSWAAALLVASILADGVLMYRGTAAIQATAVPPRISSDRPRDRQRIDAHAIVRAHLFGRAGAPLDPSGSSEQRVDESLKLTGTIVWEGDPSRSVALLGATDQRTRVLRIGMMTEADGKLEQVFHDHVSVLRDGVSVRIALPRGAGALQIARSDPAPFLDPITQANEATGADRSEEQLSRELVPASLIVRHDAEGAVVRMQNQGPETLTFKVTAVDKKSGANSTVMVTVPPNRWTRLSDAGLIVSQGAEVTIESPPYQPRSIALQ